MIIRGRRTKEGGYERSRIARPTPIGEYNKYMGGVDMSDQLLGYYSVHHKSMKWYKTLFHHFVDIASTNSYILHKDMCAVRQHTPMKHQDFQELLSAQLMGVPLDFSPGDRQYNHTPVAIAPTDDQSKKGTAGRRKCAVCRKNTPFWCKACHVPLCVIVDRNCHDIYHV
ncbi:hypothetical protein CesoFtcFv8_001560 [Champsocephalus esox]|nr:hypothetical protein CesoFtcFv8_001560 [Champsocephalus esox]